MNVLLTGWGNEIFKVVLSLSLAGSLLILVLLLLRPLLQNRFSRRWQYYIWLVPVARLLLPWAPADNYMNSLFNPRQPNAVCSIFSPVGDYHFPVALLDGRRINVAAGLPHINSTFFWPDLFNYLWLVWLAVAMLLLVRKITVYQSFAQFVRSGQSPAEDVELLNRLAEIGAELGLKKPVELAVNPLLTTPLLLGWRRRCIVLPTDKLSEADFAYTVRHELTHCQRRDMLYKWLVQLAVCLHWFNPLVWLLGREVSRACELACDEAVIDRLDAVGRAAYGDMLLRAAERGGGWQSSAALNLNQGAKLLKERLRAIMRFKRKSNLVTVFSLALAVLFVIEASVVGAYTIPKAVPQSAPSVGESEPDQLPGDYQGKLVTQVVDKTLNGIWQSNEDWRQWEDDWEKYWQDWGGKWADDWQAQRQQAPQYYAQNDVARMSMIFDELGRDTQNEYLAKAYADNNIAMFAVFLDNMTPDAQTVDRYALQSYNDNNVGFFAVLADHLRQGRLEDWLERVKADQRLLYRLILLEAAGKYDEAATLENEVERRQQAEYAQIGITLLGDGRYYFQNQLIHVLKDVGNNDGFNTLQINPEGAVSITILRDEAGNILSVSQMSAEEVKELLADWGADEENDKEDWENWDEDWDEDWNKK